MAHRRRRKNPETALDARFVDHIESILDMAQKLSDKAGKVATHCPSQYPWIRAHLQEIADKLDDLGTEFEEELHENGMI